MKDVIKKAVPFLALTGVMAALLTRSGRSQVKSGLNFIMGRQTAPYEPAVEITDDDGNCYNVKIEIDFESSERYKFESAPDENEATYFDDNGDTVNYRRIYYKAVRDASAGTYVSLNVPVHNAPDDRFVLLTVEYDDPQASLPKVKVITIRQESWHGMLDPQQLT